MSDVANLLAELTARTDAASDPMLAAVRMARASIDALVLKLGQSIEAEVTAQLAAGLTQLSAGPDSFVLKLETPLPVGTPVTIKVAATPSGQPAVTVAPARAAQPAAPPPLAAATAMPLLAAVPERASSPQPTLPASAPAVTAATPQLSPAPSAPTPVPAPAPKPATSVAPAPASIPVATTTPDEPHPAQMPAPRPTTVQTSEPVSQPPQAVPPQPSESRVAPQPAQQQGEAARPVAVAPANPAPPAPISASPTAPQPTPPVPLTAATTVPAQSAPIAQPAAPMPAVVAPSSARPLAPVDAEPSETQLPQQPAPLATAVPRQTYPTSAVPAPRAVAQIMPADTAPPAAGQAAQASPRPLPSSPPVAIRMPTPALPPLQQVLADPVLAISRQTSVAPLLAQATAIATTPGKSALPQPVIEALVRLLAGRIDLNRAAPDGKAIRAAVMQAGTFEPRPGQPADMRASLLLLRAALGSALGGKVEAVPAVGPRPAPPLAGEPARAPLPSQAVSAPDQHPEETARQLLGHVDGALARTRLLQLASTPQDDRLTSGQSAAPELRLEIPMLLGNETGILQLLVERDARNRRTPRERGWRMRFAMNFSLTGEVGADIALLGRAANVSIWAAEAATADALEAMLPELAPALASHGLDLAGLRVRRGVPPRRPQSPGKLLDSAT